MDATCLITGCAFGCMQEDKWIWGDLYQLGNMFLLDAKGGKWSCEQIDPKLKLVIAPDHYFKNDLIIFPLDIAQFNVHARDYIQASLPEESRIVLVGGTLQ